ncbi:MAG: ATP-binding protein [Alphaproteobacteria bacterium]
MQIAISSASSFELAQELNGGNSRRGKDYINGVGSSDRVNIQITDSGGGIPPNIDVFEPFVTTKNQGAGLGLVTAHNGTISYSSEPGNGSLFVTSLPRQ